MTDNVNSNTIEKIDKPYELGTAKCGFCPYRAACWPETDALKDHFATWPKKTWPKKTEWLAGLGTTLEAMFADRIELNDKKDLLSSLEERILIVMENNKLYKIQLANGDVFLRKFLKTPRPHYELRRSKL